MNRLAWRSRVVIGALAAGWCLGCSATGPAQPPSWSMAPAPVASETPLPPLVAQPVVQPPARPAAMTTRDLSVAGDPTRVVYPARALEAGRLYPAVIFLHGHGMDQTQLTARTSLAERAAAEGWLSAAGQFTGRGHWGNQDALRAVGRLIAALVADHQADPRRIYLVGFSMGGGTALLAAGNPLGLPYRVAAVASTQGFSDLAEMARMDAYARSIDQAYGGELEWAEALAHSPVHQAERLKGVPVYLEHGTADASVPPSHSQRMHDRLRELGEAPVLRLYEGKGHLEATIDEGAIVEFFRGKVAE